MTTDDDGPRGDNEPATAHPRQTTEVHGDRDRPRVVSAQPRPDGIDAATRAMRRAAEALLRAGPGAEGLDGITAELDDIADRLERCAPTLRQRMVDMWQGEGTTRHDPVTGPENVIAPPLTLSAHRDGWVDGTVVLGLLQQGPPGFVHGGISALLLDHTLGVANFWAGTSGMTAQLNVRYHRPTPLHEPLVVRARQVGTDGRKIHTEGLIADADGTTCVSAQALFVTRQPPRPRAVEGG